MVKRTAPPAAIGAAIIIFVTLPAHALSDRVLVSAKSGADNPGCGAPATPCRTFQRAHDNATAGGQISVMDPGDYGPVTIAKSIGIVNDGAGTAGILQIPAFGTGITIAAGVTDRVFLRGLAVEGRAGGQTTGLELQTAGSLTIANCVFRGHDQLGVSLRPSVNTSFAISDTLALENDGGVVINPVSGAHVGILDRVLAHRNSGGAGIFVTGATVSIVDSVASHNCVGVQVVNNAVGNVRGTAAIDNGHDCPFGQGFLVNGINAVLRLAHSVATGNLEGVSVGPLATAESYGDNNLRGNGTNVVGSLTTVVNQ